MINYIVLYECEKDFVLDFLLRYVIQNSSGYEHDVGQSNFKFATSR